MKRALIFLVIASTGSGTSVLGQPEKLNVLFIGNSLTYQNNLPELVREIAACEGIPFTYTMIALPDYALEDHWNDGQAGKEINSGKYNFVVVQQGPSSQTEGFTLLKDYGVKFAELGKANNAQLVFYMVWPAKARSFDFPGVYRSYKSAATRAQSVFSPAGQAWLTLWKTNPDFLLYGQDNFHPNEKGSLLAALVLYGSIRGSHDLQFADLKKLKLNTISGDELKLLVNAAEQTLMSEQR
jgi:hypothetical protein